MPAINNIEFTQETKNKMQKMKNIPNIIKMKIKTSNEDHQLPVTSQKQKTQHSQKTQVKTKDKKPTE